MADLAEMRRQLEDRRAELEGLRESSAQARGAVQLDQQSVGRISRIGGELGSAVANFRKGLNDGSKQEAEKKARDALAKAQKTLDDIIASREAQP